MTTFAELPRVFPSPVRRAAAVATLAAAIVVFAPDIVRVPAHAAHSRSPISCPDCSLTKQKSVNRLFNLTKTEFLKDPKPFAPDGRRAEFQVIARVLSLSPMTIEVLDTEPWGSYENDNCGIRVFRSIDAKLKPSIAKLQYNDLVKASMFFGGDFDSLKMVLSDLKAIERSPVYFHPEAGKEVCANRTGILIIYRGRGAQLVIVYNDGSLYYRGVMFKSFHRQKLTGEELEEMLKLFANIDFDALPGSVPPMDKPEEPSISLICSRFQDVPGALAGQS